VAAAARGNFIAEWAREVLLCEARTRPLRCGCHHRKCCAADAREHSPSLDCSERNSDTGGLHSDTQRRAIWQARCDPRCTQPIPNQNKGAIDMTSQWGRKESVIWPPHSPIYTYGALSYVRVDRLLCVPSFQLTAVTIAAVLYADLCEDGRRCSHRQERTNTNCFTFE